MYLFNKNDNINMVILFMKKKIIIVIISLILIYLIIINIKFGYEKEHIIYEMENGSQTVVLGVPRLSFKFNDSIGMYNYSYNNIRSKWVLSKEVKSFLDSLEERKCNDLTYYYDKKNDFSIVEYDVLDFLFYRSIKYKVRYGDYCQ